MVPVKQPAYARRKWPRTRYRGERAVDMFGEAMGKEANGSEEDPGVLALVGQRSKHPVHTRLCKVTNKNSASERNKQTKEPPLWIAFVHTTPLMLECTDPSSLRLRMVQDAGRHAISKAASLHSTTRETVRKRLHRYDGSLASLQDHSNPPP